MKFFALCSDCNCYGDGECTGEFVDITPELQSSVTRYWCNGCFATYSKQPLSCLSCRTRYFTDTESAQMFD